MSSEKLIFENKQGQKLAGRLELPVDGEPVAFALFAHCFTCGKDLKAASHICRALARQRIATLRFDFTGLGESEGEFADTSFSSSVDDLVAAAAALGRHYQPPRILVGHSLGGTAALQAAPRIDGVTAVATIGAPSDPQHLADLIEGSREEIERTGQAVVRLAGRPFRIKKQLLEDLEAQRMEETFRRLRCALLVCHSPADRLVGIENATRIFQAARHPKSFVSLDDADHLLSANADSRYVGTLLAAWARKYIDVPQQEATLPETADNRVVARLDGNGFRTEILANGHPLVADEPEAVGGTNAGPSPYDLLVAGLGACTAMTLHMSGNLLK